MIRAQFLVEVVIIGLLGGLVGVLMGIGVGNLVAGQLDAPFILPWNWMFIALALSGGPASAAAATRPARSPARPHRVPAPLIPRQASTACAVQI